MGWAQQHRNELTHYGIPGMKWGVTKDRSDKLQRYKAKQSTLAENRYQMDSLFANRRESRANAKLAKLSQKGYGSQTKKYKKAQAKLSKAKQNSKYVRDSHTANLDSIRNMSYQDMIKQKRAGRSAVAASVVSACAGVAAAQAVGFGVFSVFSPSEARLKQRMKSDRYSESMKSMGYTYIKPMGPSWA